MRIKQDSIIDIFCEENITYKVPIYQRDYDWKVKQCEQLYRDVKRLIGIEESKKHHFTGSIILGGEHANERYIVDGQQRMVTVSLMLLAIRDLVKEGKISTNDFDIEIINPLIFNKNNERKIMLIREDDEAFKAIAHERLSNVVESNITKNYNSFKIMMESDANEYIISDLYKAIENLIIIKIELEKHDDAQMVFESINSTGLELSAGDMIRNYLLMGSSSKEQKRLYYKYWLDIEQNTKIKGESEISDLVRQYLTILKNFKQNTNNIYSDFKEIMERRSIDKESALADLQFYSKYYKMVTSNDLYDERLNRKMRMLNYMGAVPIYPFLISLLSHNEKKNTSADSEKYISNDDILKIFSTIETFMIRRKMCDISGSHANLFSSLHTAILNLDDSSKDYFEKFKYVLYGKKGSTRMPEDQEFEEGIRNKNIYSTIDLNQTVLVYINEYIDEEAHYTLDEIIERRYTIEHVMPVVLNKKWVEELGPDHHLIHEEWRDKLANITLTGYNSQYSNNSFSYKRDFNDGKEKGLSHSGIGLNRWIGKQEKWNLDTLNKRNSYLTEILKNIFPYETSSYISQKKDGIYDLSHDDFKHKKIESYTFMENTEKVKNWVNFYISVVKKLYEIDSEILINEERNPSPGYPTMTCGSKKNYREIKDGLYISVDNDNNGKVGNLTKLLELYNMKSPDIIIKIIE